MKIRLAKMTPHNEHLAEPFTVSLSGENEVSVTGCRRVLTYEDALVRIETVGCVVAIEGDALSLKAFHENEMRISGRIDKLGIERG